MGHQGATFSASNLAVDVKVVETNTSAAGIYRSCVMAYNQYG